MTTPIKVEQVDRDAAADSSPHNDRWGELARHGHVDSDPLILAFAAHRIAAEAKTREEDARIAANYERDAGNSYNGAALTAHKVGLKGEQIAAHNIATAIRSRMETNNGR